MLPLGISILLCIVIIAFMVLMHFKVDVSRVSNWKLIGCLLIMGIFSIIIVIILLLTFLGSEKFDKFFRDPFWLYHI
jgi:hypothetical protein